MEVPVARFSNVTEQVRRAPDRSTPSFSGRTRNRRVTTNRLRAPTVATVVCAAMALVLCCALPEGEAETDSREAAANSHVNRLARESSPYLLSHAHNPVDWYPWGPEALEKARQEDKPIFLSIGYSSCHWCHVMEKLVFSNDEIARYMNEHFINIKVDREERPDIDDLYMTALQMYFQAIKSTQTGGWPLSIFLTPDGRPLGGGTFFPPRDEPGRTGFPAFMTKVYEAWRNSREQMQTNAEILAQAVRSASRPQAPPAAVSLEKQLLQPVLQSLQASYDSEEGGFGYSRQAPDRPKFPVPTKLALLQFAARQPGGADAGNMLYHTLNCMAAGGIYDHVGGGFHRYSTDRRWRVPHFEKMLYDNAQLLDVYAEAFRHTSDPLYRDVCDGIVEFVERELTDPQGGFYAALDADTEGVEGKYYIWTDEQLRAVLSADEQAICRRMLGTGEAPNLEGGHVLRTTRTIDEAAAEMSISALELDRRLAAIRKKLLDARRKRTAPFRDDKILTAWNGLMIRALARSGVIFDKPERIRTASKAAEYVLATMRDDQGRLLHVCRAGSAKIPAYLDDYAFLVEGLLSLHLATGDEKWANAARRLTDQQMQLFWDDKENGCYFTANDQEVLLARTKNAYDSVIPSGNSVTVRNLLRLATFSRNAEYRVRARKTLEAFVPAMEESQTGMTNMALALSEYLDLGEPAAEQGSAQRRRLGIAPEPEIVLAAGEQEEKPSAKARAAQQIVTAQAYLSTDRLPAGSACKLLVDIQIADGWHIHANPAGDPEFDVATELEVASKLGTKLTRLQYPAGTKVPRAEGEPPQLLYVKRVALVGALEVPANAAGRREELTIRVRQQACNDHKCLSPKTIELVVPINVAARGERVRSINDKLFNPPAARNVKKR